MLRGYSFEPMSNSRALATAGLFMTIGLQKKMDPRFRKPNLAGKNNIDLSSSSGCGDPIVWCQVVLPESRFAR